MKVAIHQPYLMPWPGYFARVMSADIFVWLDDVQFEKGGYTNRVKVLNRGQPTWLTVPVKRKSDTLISEAIPKFDTRVINLVWSCYWQFTDHYELLVDLTRILSMTAALRNISAMDMLLFRQLCDYMNLQMPLTLKSGNVSREGTKGDRILNICKELGATEYISGPFGLDYLDIDAFHENGIDVTIQYYKQEEYKQAETKGFVDGLSVIDMIFNAGVEKTRDHILESLC